MDDLQITEDLSVPAAEFRFSYVRSSGPGGQNVNKVNTKVTLRWDIQNNASLPDDVRRRAQQRYASRISKEGHFLVHSQRFRERERNVNDWLEKLRKLLEDVSVAPKKRRKTCPSRASKQRRLKEKKENAAKKEMRRRPRMDD